MTGVIILWFDLAVLSVHLLDLQPVKIDAVDQTYIDRLYCSLLICQLTDDGNAARLTEGMSGSLCAKMVAL